MTTPMRPSPAINSSPPIAIGSLYRRPIPIGSLSLTTGSFLHFSLSPLTTPIPIHFSSPYTYPYPYPYPFRFCLSDAEIVDAKPLVLSRGTLQTADSKEPFARLDKLILDAITNLKEPRGSDRAAIALYIEERYWAPPNLKKLLSTKLKHMSANGRLIKIKHKYRIASSSTFSEKRRSSSLLVVEERQKDSSRAEKREINILTKTQVDAELSKMKGMTAQEAAAAAARAVAEAEAAIAEAEKAAREAEAAEAEAEAAQVFAKAAMKALKCGTLRA